MGEYCQVTVGGKSFDVILCAEHRSGLEDLAKWGRPAKPRPAQRTKRRDTSEARLLSLYQPDTSEA